jgi:16S rRNA (guanine527-N7)-methyltransferase
LPREPEAFETAAIRRGADELGVTLSENQAERLAQYARLLLKWNRVYNLTARTVPEDVLTHHLLDSLSIVPEVARAIEGRAGRVLDVGAGGGLPGIPVAIALPDARLTLIDAVQKKAAFLAQARLELELENVTTAHARIEDYRAPPFDVVTARAFASLEDLVRLTTHLVREDGSWLAMKGAYPAQEIRALDATAVEMVRAVKLRVPHLNAERHLVILRFRQSNARHL